MIELKSTTGEKVAVNAAAVTAAIDGNGKNGANIGETILHVAGIAVKVLGAIDDVLQSLFGKKDNGGS